MKRTWIFGVSALVLLALVVGTSAAIPPGRSQVVAWRVFRSWASSAARSIIYPSPKISPCRHCSRLAVLDVAQPQAPARAGQTEVLPGIVDNVTVHGKHVYAGLAAVGCASSMFLTLHNLPLSAFMKQGGLSLMSRRVGSIAFVASSPVWDGSHWTAAACKRSDISDPSSPRLLAAYDTPGWEMAVAVMDDHAYIADGDGGMRVLNVSNPAAPFEVDVFETIEPAMDVAASDGYLYIADYLAGSLVLDVSTPSSPRQTGAMGTAGRARRLVVSDGFVYVAGEKAGVSIVDVSQVGAPSWQGSIEVDGDIWGIHVQQGILYLADRKNGVCIVDARDKTNPVLVGYYDTLGHVDGIAVLNDIGGDVLAFVAGGDNLRTMCFPTEGLPTILAVYRTMGTVTGCRC